MTPRSDTVARLFLDGCRIVEIARELRCDMGDVEDALRRRFIALERPEKK